MAERLIWISAEESDGAGGGFQLPCAPGRRVVAANQALTAAQSQAVRGAVVAIRAAVRAAPDAATGARGADGDRSASCSICGWRRFGSGCQRSWGLAISAYW